MFKRTFLAISALAASAASVYAGTVAYVAPAAPAVPEETATMAGSGMWLIPLLAIALIALAMSNNNTPPVSDARAKRDIKEIGVAENGLPLYEFRYIFGRKQYIGVMAQDVLKHTPEAVVRSRLGFYRVNYDMLGLEMKTVH